MPLQPLRFGLAATGIFLSRFGSNLCESIMRESVNAVGAVAIEN